MTYEHSAALGAFGNAFLQALGAMGLELALQIYSGATMKGEEKSKQDDNGWSPKRPPRGHDCKWPTVVLEVAVSESQSKLQSAVRFWLREGQGKVKVVFTLAVDRQSPNITIEKWETKGGQEGCTQQVTRFGDSKGERYWIPWRWPERNCYSNLACSGIWCLNSPRRSLWLYVSGFQLKWKI